METKTGPEIRPGETTTEYEAMKSSSFFGIVLAVVGSIGTILPPIIQALTAIPGVESNEMMIVIISCGSALVAVAGGIMKALGDSAYIQGRSLVKAAAARDLPPPPAI